MPRKPTIKGLRCTVPGYFYATSVGLIRWTSGSRHNPNPNRSGKALIGNKAG